jgi:heme/copper-type cytochrome/quinol oxidase subunit 3
MYISIILNQNKIQNQQHPFHVCDSSFWPLIISSLLYFNIVNWVYYINYVTNFFLTLTLHISFFALAAVILSWSMDVIKEATFLGYHTIKVQLNLHIAMVLFLASEVMFFFSFFWAFFHYSINPSIWLGTIWPPKGIDILETWGLPALNTHILLVSGATLVFSHKFLALGDYRWVTISLAATIFLGLLFTYCQYCEYKTANFTINDSVYGSIFYLATGFHGFHVIAGTSLLIICLIRNIYRHFLKKHHFGFIAAAWYWCVVRKK